MLVYKFIVRRRVKKIVNNLRKEYVRTGIETHIIMQHDYNFDVEVPLMVLWLRGVLAFEYDDDVADRGYYITIKVEEKI